jgi:hypothetical protein
MIGKRDFLRWCQCSYKNEQMAMQEVMQTCQGVAFMNKHVTGRRNITLINFPKTKKESLHNSEYSHVL